MASQLCIGEVIYVRNVTSQHGIVVCGMFSVLKADTHAVGDAVVRPVPGAI